MKGTRPTATAFSVPMRTASQATPRTEDQHLPDQHQAEGGNNRPAKALVAEPAHDDGRKEEAHEITTCRARHVGKACALGEYRQPSRSSREIRRQRGACEARAIACADQQHHGGLQVSWAQARTAPAPLTIRQVPLRQSRSMPALAQRCLAERGQRDEARDVVVIVMSSQNVADLVEQLGPVLAGLEGLRHW